MFTAFSTSPTNTFTGQIVVIFLRGGMDGLHAVMPAGDPDYFELRPNLSVATANGIPLDDTFILHAGLKALYPLYQAGDLAIVHACGSPSDSHSHFDSQDFMEHGTPDDKSVTDGWLARMLVSASLTEPLQSIAVSTGVPEGLKSSELPVVALSSLEGFSLLNTSPRFEDSLSALYALDPVLSPTANTTFSTIRQLQGLLTAQTTGNEYPDTPFAAKLRDVATLLKSDLGVRALTLDLGDWDTHENEESRLQANFEILAEGLAAFQDDLGTHATHVSTVVMTEFGRRAYENASGGTDHGHGSCLFVLGDGINGGKVHGPWPGLASEALHGPGDLEVTTDFRSVLASLLNQRHGVMDFSDIFPGFDWAATPLSMASPP